jgi:hypothetical protein
VHFAAGQLPNPVFTSIILGVLVRAAQFVKCASGASFLPRLFAHSLYDADSKLGACLEIAEWRGGSAHLETPILNEADCVTATGSDETLAAKSQARSRQGALSGLRAAREFRLRHAGGVVGFQSGKNRGAARQPTW